MFKKIFITVLLINVIFFNILVSYSNKEIEKKSESIEKKVVDIKSANDLINTYSNLIKEIIPANEPK
jgi:hypothetical protein